MSYRSLTRGIPTHENKLFLLTYLGYFDKAAKQFDFFKSNESFMFMNQSTNMIELLNCFTISYRSLKKFDST